MSYNFAPATADELTQIMAIEHSGFSDAEAASTDSMAQRIAVISDTFIVAHTATGAVAGYIVGPASKERYITDDLFETTTPNQPNAPYQTVLSLAVAPNHQGQGIAGALLTELAKVAKAQNRQAITLTCLKKLVPFYEAHGYQNEGVAASDHAGETWYNLVLAL